MASSGKKVKKPKGKTIALTEFLADGSGGGSVPVIRGKLWADEVENDDDMGYGEMGSRGSKMQAVVLPTAPRATRSLNVDDENIPKNPPFNAYISNLQYDVDEEEIADFFKDMKIVNVRLPRDDRGSGRLKGFGYVEFETRESLIAALNIGETTIKGRRMRIEIASSSDSERGGRGGRGGMREMGYDMSRADHPDGPDRTLGDWRSGPRAQEPADTSRPGGGGFNRDGADRGAFTRDNMDQGATSRNTMDRGSFTRDNMDRGAFSRDNMDRGPAPRDTMDRGSFTRDNMDRGAFSRDNMDRGPPPRDMDRGSFSRDNMDRGSFTRDNMDRGAFTRDNMDRGPPPRDNMDRGSFARDNMDRGDRDDGGFSSRRDGGYDRGSGRGGRGEGPGYPERDRFGSRGRVEGAGAEPEEGVAAAPAAVRPKLNLIPRGTLAPEAADLPAVPAQAAIFGGAKPVDTAARERQIEERLLAKTQGPPSRLLEKEAQPAKADAEAESKGTPAPVPPENAWGVREAGSAPPPPAAHDRVNNVAARRPTSERGGGARGGAYRGGGHARGGSAAAPPREAKRDHHHDADAAPRMPKLRQQASPNFVASNKYGVLPSEEDTANAEM